MLLVDWGGQHLLPRVGELDAERPAELDANLDAPQMRPSWRLANRERAGMVGSEQVDQQPHLGVAWYTSIAQRWCLGIAAFRRQRQRSPGSAGSAGVI